MRSLFVLGFLFAVTAHAEVVDKRASIAGMNVQYRVVLPQPYDSSRTYPGVLAFVGGGQTYEMVRNEVDRTWKPEAERRGYIVVLPAASDGQLFFEKGDRIFPQFLDQLLKDYKIEGNKFHIAGHSNGGLSAFHIAAKYPRYFRTLTGFPGYLPEDENADAIKPMCIFMHVGERDLVWQGAMEPEMERLKARGFRIQYKVEPKEPHLIQALQGAGVKRLFDQFESCK